MEAEAFGELADGRRVERVTIAGGGLIAKVLSWGAVLQDLRLAGHAPPLVLGFDAFEPYTQRSPYFGAIVGRYANRIGEGRFIIDGRTWQADRNFRGKHTLHGGADGIGSQLWTIRDHGADFVTLAYRAADGEMGFPGNLDIACTYRLKASADLVIELSAVTDAPTLCNLAHHSYFNLDDGGASEALGHILQIGAEAFLPVDAELIPTGDIVAVNRTEFDFRLPRPIRNGEGGAHRPYDHNFCLAEESRPLRRVARAVAARSEIEMEVYTTEPGLQFYDGAGIAGGLTGLDGIVYGAHSGFCLEAQTWPDAPNRPTFPPALLRPGERYAQTTEYRFRLP